jgi:glutaredoxin-related protein
MQVGPMNKGKPELSDLQNAFNAWMGEHISLTGLIPPGNASKSDIWAAPPMKLHLVPEQADPTESQDQPIKRLLNEHHMVVFIHGPPQMAMKKHDLEHYASTRVLGLLISHGLHFVTVDLVEECHSGLRECLHESFGCATCPQVLEFYFV